MLIETVRITEIYRNAFLLLNEPRRPPEIKVEFYPYVGVNSRIRLRDGLMIVRISDVLRDAPLEFHAQRDALLANAWLQRAGRLWRF